MERVTEHSSCAATPSSSEFPSRKHGPDGENLQHPHQLQPKNWFGLSQLGPFSPFMSGWENRSLILRLAKREIESRYRGSLLGMLWSVLVPVIMLLVYAFVFTVVFETKWAVPVQGKSQFALLLFTGLILFNLFVECLNRAPSLMLSHANYIKKVVFPLETLSWVVVLVACFNAFISSCVLASAYLLLVGVPHLTVLLLPLVTLPLLLFALGFTLFFASVGLFVRDTQQAMGLLTTILMFMSPLFYPLSSLPHNLQIYLRFSPIATAIEDARNLIFAGQVPELWIWIPYFALSWLVAWAGYVWFIKTKKGFADVL